MNNEKYSTLFSSIESKATAFDKIAEMFYDKNFSSATKSEIELQMFSIYMDATIKRCEHENGTIDYNACSDYEMGKELGIPQEKVRTLKIKKQARYPVEFDWKKSLLSVKDSVRYDKGKNKIIIPTRDPNLYNEIRNYIEDHGGYIEIKRSGNYIQIRPEHYFMLIYEGLGENDQRKCRKELVKELQKRNKHNEIPEAVNPYDVVKQLMELAKFGVKTLFEIKSAEASALWEIFDIAVNNM